MKNIIIFIGKAWEVEKPVPLGIGGIKNTLAAVRALTKRYSRRQKEEGRRKR